eukprot:COSAG06_NODE_185_length_20838_cov_50.259463_16_plen_102_part_00
MRAPPRMSYGCGPFVSVSSFSLYIFSSVCPEPVLASRPSFFTYENSHRKDGLLWVLSAVCCLLSGCLQVEDRDQATAEALERAVQALDVIAARPEQVNSTL